MKNSKIEWCDHTFNPWSGCTKVSPGCAHCYAETLSHRFGGNMGQWGHGAPRKRTSAAYWRQPLKWDKDAGFCPTCGEEMENDWWCECCGVFNDPVRPRVFCGSLCDWLDDEVPVAWLANLLALINRTRHLDWLLLTKRPKNFAGRMAAAGREIMSVAKAAGERVHGTGLIQDMGWLNCWITGTSVPPNVWIGASVEDQERADERIPALLRIPAHVRFLSCEPLLGPVDLRMKRNPGPMCRDCADSHVLGVCDHDGKFCISPDWVICGGESGHGARAMPPEWARGLRDQCESAGVPFFMKQLGGAKDKRGQIDDLPEDLRVRQFPL